ncbi:MAG: GNAT family N-acetyltransferase [Ignavibacteriae bacterium]|nr:MAG: GNAT family N-acetyltransferase [Ignavibacteriota bacterium]
MEKDYKIVTLTPENALEYGCSCFLNPKNIGHEKKQSWLKKRFAEGMTLKLLYTKGEKKPSGFIEYVPGEYTWRAVDAKNYYMIHCIWIYSKSKKNTGYGSMLIKECIKDAKKNGYAGAAVVTGSNAFMAQKGIFLKNGFKLTDSSDDFELYVLQFKKAPLPKINDWKKQLKKFKGFNLVYSAQCPWIAKSITDIDNYLRTKGIEAKIKELKTPLQAQKAPSVYSTFSFIYDGEILANHYISVTRCRNIIEKELKL